MQGQVSGHHALVTIAVRLDAQRDLSIEFAVDTGFIGFLALPTAAVRAMNLPFLRRTTANLADDSTIRVSVHTMTIVWDGQEREVEVLATGPRPLVGALLMDGHELLVQYADGGLVTIEVL